MSAVKGRRSDPMAKRIPTNPKYQNVRATIDTGASLSKHMDKIEELKRNYKFKKDEIFARMKCSTFVQLIVQVQRIGMMEDPYDNIPPTPASLAETSRSEMAELDPGYGDGAISPSLVLTEGDYGEQSEIQTQRSTLLSVAGGRGELDLNHPPEAPRDRFVNDACPYLLLDLRDRGDYDGCHIISAVSYPKAMLSRASNYESKEMLSYKNKPGKIIVVYDEDERIAHDSAKTLVQRGYDNIFMLSGGLKVALQKFPEGMTTGTPPAHLVAPLPRGTKPPPVSPALQQTFTEDDVDRLAMYLDHVLQDHSTGNSSRLSQISSRSSKMTSRSTTAASQNSLHNRPFKP